jgi:hypothetical protein
MSCYLTYTTFRKTFKASTDSVGKFHCLCRGGLKEARFASDSEDRLIIVQHREDGAGESVFVDDVVGFQTGPRLKFRFSEREHACLIVR